MNSLFIGQSSSGKTTNIKNQLEKLDGRVLILDFNNQYDDFVEDTIYLDDVNPLLGEVCIDAAKALNAGYLHDSACLYKTCEGILREVGENKKEGLIEEAIERLHISWNATEMAYAKILNHKIPLRRHRRHITLDSGIEMIKENSIVSLKSKSMHSDHLRAVTFALLSHYSKTTDEPLYIVCDDISNFFNQGNIKLLLSTLELSNLNFILSFNKFSNIPKAMLPLIDTYFVHRFETNNDIKELNNLGIELSVNIKKFSNGEFAQVEATSLVTN